MAPRAEGGDAVPALHHHSFLPQVPTLLLLGHHFVAAGFCLGAVCCCLLLREEILILGIPWEMCSPVGPAQWCCMPVLRSLSEPALVLHRSVGRSSLENDYPEKRLDAG